MSDDMADRVGLALLSCMAGIGLCFYANTWLSGEPRHESSGILGKVNCFEIEQVLRTAPPEFRPPEDTIRSMVERCRSQEALSEES